MNNVRTFGAIGDGVANDTVAIQAAVDAGGMAYFPAGVYRSGSIYLKSHGGLNLAPGAVLMMSPNMDDFNAPDFVPWNSTCPNEYAHGKHLLIAVEQENITICGGGKIHGNDLAFMNSEDPIQEFMPGIYNVKPCGKPGTMLYFCLSRKITLRDVELVHSSYWHCFLHGCQDVLISGVRITGDHHVNTNDGIDLDCCKNVVVSDCIIDTADDAIAIRGNAKRLQERAIPCENILVSNCILSSSYACAVRVGVGDGEIRNCSLDHILVPHAGIGILLQSRYSESSTGVSIHDISFSRWNILHSTRPFKICHETFKAVSPNQKPIANISFSDIVACGERTVFIQGNGIGEFGKFIFHNITLNYAGCGKHPEIDPNTGWWGKISTDAVFEVMHTASLDFEHIAVHLSHPGWHYLVRHSHTENLTMEKIKTSIPLLDQNFEE